MPQPGARPPSLQMRNKLWIRAVLWLNDLHRRLLAVFFAAAGPRVAYAVTDLLARLLYRLLPPIRERGEAQCRAALGNRLTSDQVAHVAERSFMHRAWNLTDLMLADRLLHSRTYRRFGGQIPEPHLTNMLQAQRRGQPTILLTAYYGPFDLLPVFLGFNGIRAGVVYRTHLNTQFDAYRRRIREQSGCELIPVERAVERLPQILEAGGTVAIVADHHAERRGLPVTFLGLPTMAVRSVGLLAWRFDADVAVAGIRRVGGAFRFEIEVTDTMKARDWAGNPDPVRYITERYLRALETLVLRDPSQYVWAYARWGRDLAQRLTAGEPVQAANQLRPSDSFRMAPAKSSAASTTPVVSVSSAKTFIVIGIAVRNATRLAAYSCYFFTLDSFSNHYRGCPSNHSTPTGTATAQSMLRNAGESSTYAARRIIWYNRRQLWLPTWRSSSSPQ